MSAFPTTSPSSPGPSSPGTVLVLGATGRFGRHAAHAFDRTGWRVRTFGRRAPGADVPGEHDSGDVLDARALGAAASGADVLVNALNPPYRAWRDEVPRLTEAVLGAARSSGATVMLPGNVYGFGRAMPPILLPDTPEAPSNEHGRVRSALEAGYRAAASSGARTIVVRAGSFVEGVRTGNWFEDHVVSRIDAGRVMYPGPLDRTHSWAWLPDLGRAFEALAARRDALEPFHVVGFPGWALTGRELVDALETATGRPLRVGRMPWPLLRLAAPFAPDMRGVLVMRYLWQVPHAIDGAELARLLPGFAGTPAEVALPEALERLGAAVPSRAATA